MKLSDVLENYYVCVNSSLVGFHWSGEENDNLCGISYQDVDGMEVSRYFNDQEVEKFPHLTGGFVATDDMGNQIHFIALTGVDLTDAERNML